MGNTPRTWEACYRPSARMRRAQDAVDAHAEFRGRIMSTATNRLPARSEEGDEVEQEHGLSPAAGNDPDDVRIGEEETSYESEGSKDEEEDSDA